MYFKGEGKPLIIKREALGRILTKEVKTDALVGVRVTGVGELSQTDPAKGPQQNFLTIKYGSGRFGRSLIAFGDADVEKVLKLKEGDVINASVLSMSLRSVKLAGDIEIVPVAVAEQQAAANRNVESAEAGS